MTDEDIPIGAVEPHCYDSNDVDDNVPGIEQGNWASLYEGADDEWWGAASAVVKRGVLTPSNSKCVTDNDA